MTKQYNGGYFLFNEPIVRGYEHHSHTSQDLGQLSDYTIKALNYVQNTPWQMNPFLFDLVQSIYDRGLNLTNGDDTLLWVNKPVDPRLGRPEFDDIPREAWDAMSKDDKQEFKAQRARLLDAYDEDMGVWNATRRIMTLAREMVEHETFYFPHNYDFRLRMYPISTDLTPQSNDLSKSLLQFRRPTPLGSRGLYWLAFNVANHWGEDKLHPDARVDFALEPEFFKKCEAWVDAPMRDFGWTEADKPFQFMAAAHSLVWAIRSGDPSSFPCHIPGDLDGSCNGAQHLSIMARDQVGAKATNCTASDIREDLYLHVADRVLQQVQKDAKAGNLVAQAWLPRLLDKSKRRKVVKRAVMTVPYGVTPRGIYEFMISDKHVDKKKKGYREEAGYMRDLIWSAIDGTLKRGKMIQKWFSDCATIVAEDGKPLSWDTPAGSKVTQAYRNLVEKRIQSFGTKFVVYMEPNLDEDGEEFLARVGFDVAKSAAAAPPNVVHSCDAAHLQITVFRMYGAGIRDFSMVHDSFGCPMAQMDVMRDIIRQTAVDMYAGNYLMEWKDSVERYTEISLPNPPDLGEFDITEILQSIYFFS